MSIFTAKKLGRYTGGVHECTLHRPGWGDASTLMYRPGPGAARDRRRGRAGRGGPAAAWYFVYLGISLYILDIFGYIWIYIWSILLGGGV